MYDLKIVLRCHACGHVHKPKDMEEIVMMCQLKEWGMLKTTRCDKCEEVGKLNVETMGGASVKSNFGDDFVTVKNNVKMV